MPHIVALTGKRLLDMLLVDGWEVVCERDSHCYMVKSGKHRVFPLDAPLGVKLVKSIAKSAGWSAERFEKLLLG